MSNLEKLLAYSTIGNSIKNFSEGNNIGVKTIICLVSIWFIIKFFKDKYFTDSDYFISGVKRLYIKKYVNFPIDYDNDNQLLSFLFFLQKQHKLLFPNELTKFTYNPKKSFNKYMKATNYTEEVEALEKSFITFKFREGITDFVFEDIPIRSFVYERNSMFGKFLQKNGVINSNFSRTNFSSQIYISSTSNTEKLFKKLRGISRDKMSVDTISQHVDVYMNNFKIIDKVVGRELDENGKVPKKEIVKKEIQAEWIKSQLVGFKGAENLYIPSEIREEIMRDINTFGKLIPKSNIVDNRKAYFISGPAGTGKTTFGISLGATFGINVYVFRMYSEMTEKLFIDFMSQCKSPCVILFEEGDEFLANYENYGIGKTVMRNIFDGAMSASGRFIIITSNISAEEFSSEAENGEKEKALLRKGRIDKFYNFRKPTMEEITDYIFQTTNIYFHHSELNQDMELADVKVCQQLALATKLGNSELSGKKIQELSKAEILLAYEVDTIYEESSET